MISATARLKGRFQSAKKSISLCAISTAFSRISIPKFISPLKNTLANDGSEESVKLAFQDMKDFEPEAVARQIPQLRVMLAMRNLLRDLKSICWTTLLSGKNWKSF